jgi:RluA family pseudouridine synthase
MNEYYNIIHKDNDFVIINKNAGVLSIPDRYNPALPSLDRIIKEDFQDAMVVHRLDKDTSGIMVFPLNSDAHRILNEQFEKRKIKKIYHAVVSGIVSEDNIEIDIPLMTNPGKKGGVIPSARGKESLSILKVLERFKNSTLVEIDLVTGRHHQLRAHVAAVGHPLLIDPLYSNTSEFYLSSVKRKYNKSKSKEERPIISRITMHAYSLELIHPITNEKVYYEAPYPKDFAVLIKQLGKFAQLPDHLKEADDFFK